MCKDGCTAKKVTGHGGDSASCDFSLFQVVANDLINPKCCDTADGIAEQVYPGEGSAHQNR